MKSQQTIVRYTIAGARRWSNYIWGGLMCIGGIGFVLTGVSSYLGFSLLPIIHPDSIQFFPQGIVMCFYGTVGCILGTYIWLSVIWNLGEGFNEIDLERGFIRIFRWGFPGKNRRIDFQYPIQDIESIRLELQEGFTNRRALYLKVRGNREIPLTRIGQPITIQELETQAAELAKLLQVSIEGL